jgi:two-component system, LytTR family, response regulator
MPAIRTAIVDDEKPARDRIRDLLDESSAFEVVFEASNGREALEAIELHRPDLIFLDVQMPELDGFGVLQELRPQDRPPGIIFVTAYDRYAIGAFEVNAIDYLLKPFTRTRFNDAVDRARSRLSDAPRIGHSQIEMLLQSIAARETLPSRIAVRSKDGTQFVRVAEIDWLESDGNYTVIHVGKSAMRTRETLSALEEQLKLCGFVRIHRSIIVNSDRIFRLEPWSHGDYLIILRDGTKLNSGRGHGEAVRALFK